MLISTLSIPITEVKHGLGKMLDIENALSEKHSKMARLLELERSPSRASLIQDMIGRFGVLRIIQKVWQPLIYPQKHVFSATCQIVQSFGN